MNAAGPRVACMAHLELDRQSLALNRVNTFEAQAYAVIDALGVRFERFTLASLGSNLGNRRDAVQPANWEGQFYRLLARRVDATLTLHYRNR